MPRYTTLVSNPSNDDFTYWLKLFSNELILNAAPDEHKVPLFQNHLGRDGLLIYEGLAEPKKVFGDVVRRMEEYFTPKFSILSERHSLLSSQQGLSESITEWSCRVRRMVLKCSYPADYVEEAMRDTFIFGLHDKVIKERLLEIEIKDLNFKVAQSKAEVLERAQLEIGQPTIAMVKHHPTNQGKFDSCSNNIVTRPKTKFNAVSHTQNCERCGQQAHNAQSCPAYGKQCHKCGKIGHYSTVCKTRVINRKEVSFYYSERGINSQ